MEEKNDLNYWPSFVDVMSSLFIVILAVFFILFLSQQYLSYLVGKGENDLRELKEILRGQEIDESIKITEDGRIKIGDDILFTFGQHTLTKTGESVIHRLGLSLKNFFESDTLRKTKFSVVVEGHTDTRGSSEFNQKLSFNRAKAVTDYLESAIKLGIQSDSLIDIFPAGYGESRLAIKTDDNVQNDANRRVEIRVVPKFYDMLSEILNNGK